MKLSGKRVSIFTLGCKVNQVEGAFLEEALRAEGAVIVPFKEDADLYLINTCAVTAKAAYEGRKLLRQALGKSPELVVITGCYAQTFPEEIFRAGRGPVAILGHAEKFRIPSLLKEYSPRELSGEIQVTPTEILRQAEPTPITHFPGHTRAFLRVQDGCSARCAYCIVPLSRGPARSLPEREVVTQTRRFVEAGYQEIVLTGIHLGVWGQDFSPPKSLVDLLRELEKLNGFRIRLSSLEVTEITEDLLEWARRSPRFCPHFHVPLQSGSDRILSAMGRPYRRDQYLEVLWRLRELFPEAALGADVLVGFPGETEEDFEKTYRLVDESPLTYLHVFPYSPRPGTPAYSLSPVPPQEIARRTKVLRELAAQKKRAFYERQKGMVLSVLIEGRDRETGLLRGLSENYVPVLLKGPLSLKGEIVKAKIFRADDFRIYGERI